MFGWKNAKRPFSAISCVESDFSTEMIVLERGERKGKTERKDEFSSCEEIIGIIPLRPSLYNFSLFFPYRLRCSSENKWEIRQGIDLKSEFFKFSCILFNHFCKQTNLQFVKEPIYGQRANTVILSLINSNYLQKHSAFLIQIIPQILYLTNYNTFHSKWPGCSVR